MADPESIKFFIEDLAFSRRMIWLFSHPLLLPSLVSKLEGLYTERLRKRDNLQAGEGEGGGGGTKSYDGDKTWSSINHSILSGPIHPFARWNPNRKY
jgi:hypothetical protein